MKANFFPQIGVEAPINAIVPIIIVINHIQTFSFFLHVDGTKFPLTQSKPASPNSHVMSQLHKLMEGVVLTGATRNVSAQIELKKELERKQKEEEKNMYDRKERGTRCLEKFREDVLKPRSGMITFL